MSKLPSAWREDYVESLEDSDLLALRADLALTSLAILDALDNWRSAGDSKTRDAAIARLIDLQDHKRKLSESERKRIVDMGQTLRLSDIDGFLQYVVQSVKEAVDRHTEPDVADRVLLEVGKRLQMRGKLEEMRLLGSR